MSTGVQSQAGIAAAASWGDSFSAATTLLPFVSENITKNFDHMTSKALIGQAAEHEAEVGRQIVQGDLVIDLDYANADFLLYAMGYYSGGAAELRMDLPMFHLEIDKGVRRYRFRSCKVNQMTISGSAGSEDPVQVTLNLIAYDASISSIAFPSLSLTAPNRVYFEDLGYVRLGNLADSLGSGDNMAFSSFELVVNHNLQADGKDTSIQSNVLEPLRNDFRQVTTKFGIARSSTDLETMDGWAADGTRLQQIVSFSDGGADMQFSFPQGKVITPPHMNVGGPGVITSEVELAWYVNNNNGNMSGIADQFEVTIT